MKRPGLLSSEFWLPVVGISAITLSGTALVSLDSEARWFIVVLAGGYSVGRQIYKNMLAKNAPPPQR